MGKICCYFNDLALYRESIYRMMDAEYDIDWFIEDTDTQCKEFDPSLLKSVSHLHTVPLCHFYLTKGLISLLKKDYIIYFFLGSTRNITLYIFLIIKCLFYRKKKVYLWTHGYYGKESPVNLALLKRPMFKMCDGAFIYGDYAISLMTHDGLNGKKLWPIHNSLNYNVQLSLRNTVEYSNIYQEHFGNNDPVLIFLGRLTPVKKLDQAIEAVKILKDRGENYNMVLIGDGPEGNSLRSLVKKFNLECCFWFYGACYDERINAELVYNADLCLAPGNIGLTAIHALMFGCPAATHNNFAYQMPEFEAIREGKTGIFFKQNDVLDIARAISEWFNLNHDKRGFVKEACYKEIDDNWTPQYQMKILKNVF